METARVTHDLLANALKKVFFSLLRNCGLVRDTASNYSEMSEAGKIAEILKIRFLIHTSTTTGYF